MKTPTLSPTGRYSFVRQGLNAKAKTGTVLMLAPPDEFSVEELYTRGVKALGNLRSRDGIEGTASIVEKGQFLRVEITKGADAAKPVLTPVPTATRQIMLDLSHAAPSRHQVDVSTEELPVITALLTALRRK